MCVNAAETLFSRERVHAKLHFYGITKKKKRIILSFYWFVLFLSLPEPSVYKLQS